MIKLLSSAISALILSIIFTFLNGQNNSPDTIMYYTTFTKLTQGFLLLFCIYSFIGIPLSVIVDKNIKHTRNNLLAIFIYFLAGVILALVFLLFNPPLHYIAGMKLALLFGGAGFLFSIVQSICRPFTNRSRH